MNKNEKKALISFLTIYIGSAIFLISIMLYLYYNNEVRMLKESCSMEITSASMEIKSEILDSYMKNKRFIPKEFASEHVRYALYDKNKKLLYSSLQGERYVDLSKSKYVKDIYDFYIIKLNEPSVPTEYIVMESCREYQNTNKLKIYILIVLILSAVFIGLIAYFLAKILLKPVREKVEHLDRFIKDSAHELNTPISVLLTSVSMLKKGKKPEKMMKYILSSSKQISQIYNDIHFSAFNASNEDVIEEFDLKDLVQESVDYFNDISITKNIEIKAFLDDCTLLMDKTKTQKIVNNLISNSVKYSHNNSIVEVSLKNNILSVKDYGIGISKKEKKEIFKRYKRGSNNIEGGFGIGLDIVKRISSEYNLKLYLDSTLDEGSTFYIDFSSVIIGAKCDINDKEN
ncbi:sensor histidine kinase [Arcobacter sp. YIC-310]|uniref:sensor histidine kinase n=1 Tax=Arcobacter sp. YIC-310 TaxID=3376632 RepID=UPI003C2A77C7